MTLREWSLWLLLMSSLCAHLLTLWRYRALLRNRRLGRPLCELHGGDVLTPDVEGRLLMNRLIELGRQNDARTRRQAAKRSD